MSAPTETTPTTRALLACGAIAGPLFVVVFLALGATRAAYDSVRHPVSVLEIGDLGWMEQANSIATGLLMLAFAIGLRRAVRPQGGSIVAPALVALAAVAAIGAGIVVGDPANGYTPGTPPVPELTVSGAVHDGFAVLFLIVGLPGACFVLGSHFLRLGRHGWAWYSIGTGIGVIVLFTLNFAGLQQVAGLATVAGLLQRIAIVVGFLWLSSVAIRYLD